MEIFIGLGINVVSQLLKKHIAPKYGETGVQFTVFLMACIVAGFYIVYKTYPSVENFVAAVVVFFGMAITFYEVLWKKFKVVKSTDELK